MPTAMPIIDAIVGATDMTSMTDASSPINSMPTPTPNSAPSSGAPMAITDPNAIRSTATATASPTSSAVRACSGSVRSTTWPPKPTSRPASRAGSPVAKRSSICSGVTSLAPRS